MRALGSIAFAIALAACGARQPLPAGACRPSADPSWDGVPPDAPRKGADRPRVIVQVFSDFECPYCAQLAPALDRALDDYGECVAIVWRNRPMSYHRRARMAARAALEVHRQLGDAAFWRYHDRLFADQGQLERDDLERHAGELEGLDVDAFRAALDGDAFEDVLRRDRRAIHARYGTPTTLVDRRVVVGAIPYEELRVEIEDALRAAHGDP